MRKFLHTPQRRIALALAFSLFLHLLMLWLPEIELADQAVPPPPLTARLEPLSPPVAKPAPAPESHAEATPTAPEPVPAADLPPPPEDDKKAPPQAAEPLPPEEPKPAVAERPVTPAAAPSRPPLPKHAQLRYDVSQGDDNFKIGEAKHTLDIQNERYVLKSEVKTTGLVGLLKSYRLVQTSAGKADAYFLQPETFSEEIVESKGTQKNRATFDYAAKKISYANGNERPLAPETQDSLTILYQFPAVPSHAEIIEIALSTSQSAEKYRFEIVTNEELETPIGKLQTIHFRKLRAFNTEGLEIWFAREYRWLPVKISHIDRDGSITAVALIREIRVSDE